jgi:beta-galactosidase
MTESLFGTILYGASYYHEYMPHERLAADIALMQEADLTAVRMGDSIWPLVEPREGHFDFAEITRVADAMHSAGIKVILTTPTYTLPPWMVRKYPEVLADLRNGKQPTFGMRQNMNTDHPAYRFYCQRVIRALVSQFRNHPGVIGWQIDNETASYDAANRDVFLGFVDWLKARYGTVEHLNKVWLNSYWGQTLGSWEEFQQQDRPQSTGYRLDWTRYQKHRVTDFMAFQAAIVREYRRPDQFVMQDFAAGFHTDVDEGAVAAHLDVVGGNPYHPTQDRYDGHAEVLNADYYRLLKGGRYIITETNAQSLGWASTLQYPPYDGQTRLSVFTNVACGAELVSYWHWHSLHSGQETFWKGILSHDLEPNRVYAEVARTAAELKRVGPLLAGATRRADVAVIYSGDSMNALNIMPITADGHSSEVSIFIPRLPDYPALMLQLHRRFYDLNVATDVVNLDAIRLEDYRLVVLPAMYVATDAQLERIADYVRGGGHVLATFKTGFVDERGGGVFLSGIFQSRRSRSADRRHHRYGGALGGVPDPGGRAGTGPLRPPLPWKLASSHYAPDRRRAFHLYGRLAGCDGAGRIGAPCGGSGGYPNT